MRESNGHQRGVVENEASAVPKSTTPRQVLLELLFLMIAAAFVAFFGQNTPLMSALIGATIIVRFLVIGRRHDWVFFLLGFLLGGGNDYLSMARDVYRYTPHTFLPVPIPFWMLVFWGQIFVAFRQLFRLPVFEGPPIEGKPWRPDLRLVADVSVFVVLRILIYMFVRQEPIPTIAFAAVVALRFIVIPLKRNEWLLVAVTVTLGLAYEAALIAFGLYVYYDPVFLGMPAWLMIYWAFMIPIFMKGIFDRIEASFARRDRARARSETGSQGA